MSKLANASPKKAIFLLIITIAIIFNALLAHAAHSLKSPLSVKAKPAVKTKPVIYDTDMAIDDWLALIFLAKHPEIDLKAVTIAASGESHCLPAIDNVQSLLDISAAKSDIIVGCGDSYPLEGYFIFPKPWQQDSDTLSGVPIAPSKRRPSSKHAVEIIHQVISQSSQAVTLVPVGPLTNIAQWLERYPEDKTKVERVVIMGGALDVKGNIIVPNYTDGHPNHHAEWNFFVDPLAAKKVLASGLNIELVGLDVTNQVQVTSAYVAEFKKKVNNPAAKFIDDVFTKNDWFINSNEYYFWDVLAALTAVNPELCVAETTKLNVAYEPSNSPDYLKTSDLKIPALRWDGQQRRHLIAATAGTVRRGETGPSIQVCKKTDALKGLTLFSRVVNGN